MMMDVSSLEKADGWPEVLLRSCFWVGPNWAIYYRCLFNQEMNLEADGSIQRQASGNRAPPRSTGWGHKGLHVALARPRP